MSSFVVPSLVQWLFSGFLNESQSNNKEEKSAKDTEGEVKQSKSSEHKKDNVEKTASLKADSQPDEFFLFPGRASDLKRGEYWSCGGSHRGGNQKLGCDLGVVQWDSQRRRWSGFRQDLAPGQKLGEQNSDWLVYGKPVHAMADGEVTHCWRNAPENPPHASHPGRKGKEKKIAGGGNFLFVKGKDGSTVLYAHLQPGTIPEALCPHQDTFLPPGNDRQIDKTAVVKSSLPHVKAGQFLGLVGNSGRSSGPHLHIHRSEGEQAKPLPFHYFLSQPRKGKPSTWLSLRDQPWSPFLSIIIPNTIEYPLAVADKEYTLQLQDIPPTYTDEEIESLIEKVQLFDSIIGEKYHMQTILWSDVKGVRSGGPKIRINLESTYAQTAQWISVLFGIRLYEDRDLGEDEEWQAIYQEVLESGGLWMHKSVSNSPRTFFKYAVYHYYDKADDFLTLIIDPNRGESQRRLNLKIWNYLQESIFDGRIFTSHQYGPANFDEFVAEVIQAESDDAEKLKTWQNAVSTNLKFIILNTYWKQATPEERKNFLQQYDRYWSQGEVDEGLARRFLIEQYPYNDSQALYMQTLSANFPLEELINNPEEGMEVFYEVKEVLESLYIEEAEEIYLQMLVTIYEIMGTFNNGEDFYARPQLEILETIDGRQFSYEVRLKAQESLAELLRDDVQNILLGTSDRQATLSHPLAKGVKARNVSLGSDEIEASISAIEWRLLTLSLMEEKESFQTKENIASLQKVIFFDPSQAVREKAIRVYGKLMGKEARPLLRKLCLQALGEGGRRDRGLLSVIRSTLSEIREEEREKRRQRRQDKAQNKKGLRSGHGG